MELSINLHSDDLITLKQSISDQSITDTDRRLLKRILDEKRCTVDQLSLVQRVMKQATSTTNGQFHLHEFLERSQVQLPSLPKLERNPELEARCERLRAQLANREYKDMTRNVDAVTAKESPLSELGREIRAINRHLVTLFNTLFTVVGSFAFAYFGTQYLYPSGPGALASRLGVGLITATVVFFADLYFVVRSLDQETQDNKKPK